MPQDNDFLDGEGDNWLRRNKPSIDKKIEKRLDAPTHILDLYGLKPQKVLEVGCSNGFRLEYVRLKYGSECVGVEPSEEAITEAKQKYPSIRIERGIISELPITDTYDLVIVNFVLHWVSREELMKGISEIDRCIKKGGYRVLGDFLPAASEAVEYKHKENVKTFKQDYAQLFISSGKYIQIAKLTNSSQSLTRFVPVENHSDRVTTELLLKNSE